MHKICLTIKIYNPLQALARHMCRRIAVIYIVNVSMFVNVAYDMVSFAISEVTRKKLRFLSGSKEQLAKEMSK